MSDLPARPDPTLLSTIFAAADEAWSEDKPTALLDDKEFARLMKKKRDEAKAKKDPSDS